METISAWISWLFKKDIKDPVENERYYHGVLPRTLVEEMLQTPGSYLVRKSENIYQYVLSMNDEGNIKHMIFQKSFLRWNTFINGEGVYRNTVVDLMESVKGLIYPVERKAWQIDNEDLEVHLQSKLGEGFFGEVYLGNYQSCKVAVKLCSTKNITAKQTLKFLQEGIILSRCKHSNIVNFIGIAVQEQPVKIVMEYMAGGSLYNFLKRNEGLENVILIKMAKDVASGMAYLEANSCVHRDLAARNCLLNETREVKIGDFGMAELLSEGISGQCYQIPFRWTAPEAILQGEFTTKSDVWSYGVLLWEMFTSCKFMPYRDIGDTNELIQRIKNGLRLKAPPGTPDQMKVLMLNCWMYQPSERIYFKKINKKLTNYLCS